MAGLCICIAKYNTEKSRLAQIFLNMLHLDVYLLNWCNFHIWEQLYSNYLQIIYPFNKYYNPFFNTDILKTYPTKLNRLSQ